MPRRLAVFVAEQRNRLTQPRGRGWIGYRPTCVQRHRWLSVQVGDLPHGFALRRRLLRLQHVGINVCRALLTLNSRASDDCLAYSVLFRLVVITNMGLAWSASLGRVMTVIVHPSD